MGRSLIVTLLYLNFALTDNASNLTEQSEIPTFHPAIPSMMDFVTSDQALNQPDTAGPIMKFACMRLSIISRSIGADELLSSGLHSRSRYTKVHHTVGLKGQTASQRLLDSPRHLLKLIDPGS